MNQVTVAAIETVKTGPGKKEWTTWTLRKITFRDKLKLFEQNGTPHEFTSGSTFDTTEFQPGQVIECEPEINDKGFLNLKKVALYFPAPVVQTQPDVKTTGPSQRPYNEPTTNERIDQAVAFKGVIDLLCAKVLDLDSNLAQRAKLFMNQHLPGIKDELRAVIETLQAGEEPFQETPKSKPAAKLPEFKSAEQLWKYALSHGETSLTFRDKTGYAMPADIIDLKEAVKALYP